MNDAQMLEQIVAHQLPAVAINSFVGTFSAMGLRICFLETSEVAPPQARSVISLTVDDARRLTEFLSRCLSKIDERNNSSN